MQLGVFTVVLQHLRFEDALDRIAALGLTAVELGAGNYPGNTHCPADELLADAARLKEYRHALDKRGLSISALACHGNPLHPNRDVAREHHRVFEQAVLLAERLDVERLTLFSGCPATLPRVHPAELGDLCVAHRLSDHPQLAVGGGGHPLLEGASDVCSQPWGSQALL